MDEANNEHFFKLSNIPKMKRFLEGGGWVTEEKYGGISTSFEDCSILLASNELPFKKMS
jgi:hypothetical protein